MNLKENLIKRKKKISQKELQYFTEDLKISLEAGLTILEGLEMIRENTNQPEIIMRAERMKKSLINGENITKSWLDAFPEEKGETANLIGLYEESGAIILGLEKISSYLKEKIKSQKKLFEALYYPSFVFLMALVVLMWFINFFIPSMLDMVSEVLSAEDFLSLESIFYNIRLGINVSAILLIFLLIFFIAGGERRKRILKRIAGFKYLGKIIRINYLESFTHHFYHLIKSGFSVTKALEILRKEEYFSFCKNETESVLLRLREGEPLNQCFQEYGFIGKREREIIKKGEYRGTLAESFCYIHRQAQKKRAFYFSEMITYGEPFVILGAGLIAGIAVYIFYKLIFSYTFIFI